MKVHLYLAAAGTAAVLLFLLRGVVQQGQPNQVEVLSGQAQPDTVTSSGILGSANAVERAVGQPLYNSPPSEPDLSVRKAVGVIGELVYDAAEQQPSQGVVSGGTPPPPLSVCLEGKWL